MNRSLQKLFLLLLAISYSQGHAQTLSKYITVDQFGYRPDSRKIAVIRDPQTGFDAAESFNPGTSYSVVNSETNTPVYTGTIEAWNGGATDESSGDKTWWFDFSSVTAPGTYYIVDVQMNVKSYVFKIDENIYADLLKHAVRTFFYQRVGHEKAAEFAGAAWADAASHIKTGQDKAARQYNKTGDATTARDLSGGWYDAGDYNKYTNWTANYIVDLMRAYLENPGAWGDDYNIPESGNNIPDLLDEAKWGIDHLLRMQNTNGSVLSIVGLSHASPPSSATGPSYYGTASTSATLNSAAAYAIASKVFASRGMTEYAATLELAAEKAWEWAVTNPNVIFKNNDGASGTSGLGSGQQETDDYGRLVAKLEAALFLYEITGENEYKTFFESNYNQVHLIEWTFAYPFETTNQEMLLSYTTLPGVSSTVVSNIKNAYKNSMINGSENLKAFYDKKDPYQAHIADYTWGSNATKGSQGLMFTDIITYDIDATKNADALAAAEGYLHYLHGVNPLNFVYLSNMYAYGGDNGVNEFYHTWFGNGSTKWDRVGSSTYGPAPGFVTGGPNPSYDRDGCCATNSCGGSNALCDSESLAPPKGQPKQKSYKDFNTSWPLNSWSVTENSNGYQINYIRLLSKFVVANYDCSGTPDGTATYDVCNRCTGGDTGLTPETDPEKCAPVTGTENELQSRITIEPNPTQSEIFVRKLGARPVVIKVLDARGLVVYAGQHIDEAHIDLRAYSSGLYVVQIEFNRGSVTAKVIKN